MKVLDPGHDYLLTCLDGIPFVQGLRFVKRCGSKYPGNDSAYSGTTTQEVLRALIDRAEYVNNQIPCSETKAVIELFRKAIYLLEARAKRVKGEVLSKHNLVGIELEPTCDICGHIQCDRACR